jgi:hypothetical protein
VESLNFLVLVVAPLNRKILKIVGLLAPPKMRSQDNLLFSRGRGYRRVGAMRGEGARRRGTSRPATRREWFLENRSVMEPGSDACY